MIAIALALAQVAAPAVQPIRASKIVLVGDSTTAVAGGRGGSFCAEHVTTFVACVNLARGGRSSGSYRAEGSWALALNEMKTPGFVKTWVLIQFGHNDQPGKPGRSTDLATEFPANLRRYVAETRAAGAVPVLVTPLSRRTFDNGSVVQDLAPWAEATRRIAREMQVPLVDLNAISLADLEAGGEAQAERWAQWPKGATPPAPPASTEVVVPPGAARKLSFDRTHLGRAGADRVAAMMAGSLVKAVPDTAGLVFLTQPDPVALK